MNSVRPDQVFLLLRLFLSAYFWGVNKIVNDRAIIQYFLFFSFWVDKYEMGFETF